MTNQANYIVVEKTPERVVIRDVGPWDRYLSVTNGAEGVVAELIGAGILTDGQTLLYYDTEGDLDELVHKDGKFVGFAPGPNK